MLSVARAFSSSYLAREAPQGIIRRFIPLDFRSAADRVARARAAAARSTDAEVVAVLREQQARLPASAARAAAVDALACGGAAVVATGQQVGLFLGPLYGLYKAASAIAVARELQRESGVPCVPLFWLQTEDHDFAEIAGATVAGADGRPARLALDPERAVEGRALAGAFAGVLAAIFSDEGLLVLDPRDARLAGRASPIYATAVADSRALASTLESRRVALAEAGFDEQIATRAQCTLLFFHRMRADGPRFRLE